MVSKNELTELKKIVGDGNVFDDSETLEAYSKDYSFVKPRKPRLVVKPKNRDEVQGVVKYANEHQISITPRSSRISFYGAGIPSQGGIIIDLTRMNKILKVDARARTARVEPGVTIAQVQEELEKEGLMVQIPLLPHPDKSMLTSAMEREPMLIPKDEHYETLVNAEIVLSTGETFYTGTAGFEGFKIGVNDEFFIPSTRLFVGAQGTLGIMTWANLKIVHIPAMDKLFFMPFARVEDLADPIRKIQWRMLGNECFVLNKFNLAAILADETVEFEALRDDLPPWTLILCLSASNRFPEEKIAYEEEALKEVAKEFDFELFSTVAGIPGLDRKILSMFRKPWTKDKYWKFRYKGSCYDIFFMAPLDRVSEFTAAINGIAAKAGYSTSDIGIYFQPLYRGGGCYCQYGFHCDPNNAREKERVRSLYLEVSETATSMGGFFTTPYGPWADMVYHRAGNYPVVLKLVKKVFDPNNIMNPGKLCF